MDDRPEAQNLEADDGNGTTSAEILEDLISRAETLLSELLAFRVRLRDLRLEGNVELGHFRGTIQSELNMLQRLSSKPDGVQTKHIARSSNLPFLERVWSAVKKSRDVKALQKRMWPSSNVKMLSQRMRRVYVDGKRARENGAREGGILVDAITDGGRTWTKVSLVTNQRLLFDLAKQGWDSGGSEDDEDEDDHANIPRADDGDRDVPLLKTVKELTNAARGIRVRTKPPQVHVILPRIKPGVTPEIDAILSACRATGATLHCGEDTQPPPPIDKALLTMAVDPVDTFPDTLNIDCTILLALVSEFSHAKVSKEPWFHAALRRQVEIEDNENLLPSLLYPAMGERRLVCTEDAASRMREIVATIGTPSEKARTAILLGSDATKTQPELISEMQEWSAYPIPSEWRLPIHIVDPNEADCQTHNLPPEAQQVSAQMTAINRSVFLHGWATGRTTITSNRTVVKQIEHTLEQSEDLDDKAWPLIWLCPTARSLVGKEKRGVVRSQRGVDAETADAKPEGVDDGAEVPHAEGMGKRDFKGKKNGVWPMPDPLRREEQRRNGLDVLSQRQGGGEVEDRRPGGYQYLQEVNVAKEASLR